MNSRLTNSSNLFFVAIYFLMLGCSKDDGPKIQFLLIYYCQVMVKIVTREYLLIQTNQLLSLHGAKPQIQILIFLEVKNIQTNVKTKLCICLSATLTLEKGYSYEWFVTSISNDFPRSVPKVTWRFYLQGDGETNSAPFTADLISPASGEAIQLLDGAFNFIWSGADPDGDSLLYTLYVDSIDGLQIPPETN